MKFKTKYFEIEAVQFDGTNIDVIEKFAGSHMIKEDRKPSDPTDVAYQVFDVLHKTWVNFFKGQWIIRGMKGEFYPCDDEVFRSKYEPLIPVAKGLAFPPGVCNGQCDYPITGHSPTCGGRQ